MTKTAELRERADGELEDRLGEMRKELFNLRFQLATGRLDNTSRLGVVRKEIARIVTILGERRSGIEQEREERAPAAAPRRAAAGAAAAPAAGSGGAAEEE